MQGHEAVVRELEQARLEIGRVAAAARVVAERRRADAIAAGASPVARPTAVDLAGTPPHSPPLLVWTDGALTEHLTAVVRLSPELALQYSSVLVESGYTTVEDFASLSPEQLQSEFGWKAGHTKRIQQRRQVLTQTLLDRATEGAHAERTRKSWLSDGLLPEPEPTTAGYHDRRRVLVGARSNGSVAAEDSDTLAVPESDEQWDASLNQLGERTLLLPLHTIACRQMTHL